MSGPAPSLGPGGELPMMMDAPAGQARQSDAAAIKKTRISLGALVRCDARKARKERRWFSFMLAGFPPVIFVNFESVSQYFYAKCLRAGAHSRKFSGEQ